MSAHAFVNPPDDTPTEWTCTACSAVITSPQHEQNGEHVGCGGKIELRPLVTSKSSAVIVTTTEPLTEGEQTALEGFFASPEYRAVTSSELAPPVAEIDAIELAREVLSAENKGGGWWVVSAETLARALLSFHEEAASAPSRLSRTRMPLDRKSITRSFALMQASGQAVEFDFIVGYTPDGAIGEVFIQADRKQDVMLSGFLHATGILISMLLQYGVPLEKVIGKLRGMRFPPDGRVPLGGLGQTTFVMSPLDLLAQWLQSLATRSEAK